MSHVGGRAPASSGIVTGRIVTTADLVGLLIATLALGLAIVVRIREAYGSIEEDEIVAADRNAGNRE